MAALLLLGAAVGCGRPARPAPVEPVRSEWPTLLGSPQRDGYADEPAPEQVEVAWRARVGRGLVSPVLVEGPVVLATTANRMVAALSAESGEHYWEKRLGGPITGGPVRGEERIFVAEERQNGEAQALTTRKGDRKWKERIGSAPFAPLLRGDTVFYATEGGNLFALEARDGDRIWRARLGSGAAATPVAFGENVLVLTRADSIVVVERATGTVRARAALPGTPSAAPALRGDTLVVPLHAGEIAGIALPGLDVAWQTAVGAAVLAAPVVGGDGTIYVVNRDAEVWRLAPGATTAERLAALGGAARASLTLARDRLAVGRLDGTLFLLRLDGGIVWKTDLEDSISAPVTIRDRAIYVPLLRGHLVKLREPE